MSTSLEECLTIIGVAVFIIIALIKFVQVCNGDENAD